MASEKASKKAKTQLGKRSLWAGVVGGAALSALVGLSACGGESQPPCVVMTERLQKMQDLEKTLHKIGENKCVEALPTLESYFDDGLLEDLVLDTVNRINNPESSLSILKKALLKKNTARLAATIVREWDVKGTQAELAKVLLDDKFLDAREAILDALIATSPDLKSHEDLLIQLAQNNPNVQSIEINRRAIVELGKMKSVKAVPVLVKALYLRTNKGQETYQAARVALAQIPDPAVIELTHKAMKGEDAALIRELLDQGLLRAEYDATPKVVQVLVDTLDASVVGSLVSDLAAEIVPPENVDDAVYNRWVSDKSNRNRLISLGLGHIGVESSVSALGAIFRDAKLDVINQRVPAARALALIGSETAQDVLMHTWREELIVEILKAGTLEVIAQGLDDRRLAQWDEMLGILPEGARPPRKPIELSRQVKEILNEDERVRAFVKVIRDCGDKVECYVEKAKSENEDERNKAILVLGRGRFGAGQDIKDLLFDVFKNTDNKFVDTKRYALMGLTRLGNQADGARLVALGEELFQKNDKYWAEEVLTMGYGLQRRNLR